MIFFIFFLQTFQINLHIFINRQVHFILKILKPGYIMYKEVVKKYFWSMNH